MKALAQDSAAAISIPVSVNPLVSVVISVRGDLGSTLRCLASIGREPPVVAFEVIVVDGPGARGATDALAAIPGVRRILDRENRGFMRPWHAGVQRARGDYLCFLSNDAEVTTGWLDELMRTFEEFPGTGLAASKVAFRDGLVLEAGGTIAQDGTASKFDQFQAPLLPAYNYAREDDYCSGASIVVPKSLFMELGGFGRKFLPADGEDVDLALRIRDKGYRVIYQPLSTVKRHDATAFARTATKSVRPVCWKDGMKARQVPGNDVRDAANRMAKRRVLVLEHCMLTPDQDSGSAMVFNLLLLLREMNFQATFIPTDNFLYMPTYTAGLQRVGVEVLYAPHVTSVEQHLKENGERYDLVFLFRPRVFERHFEAVRRYCPKAKLLYHTVDLHFLRLRREAEVRNDETAMRWSGEMKEVEFTAMRAADASIVLSTTELELLRPELPDKKIHVFPYIGGVRGTARGYSGRRDVIFVGGYNHPPNVDAVQFFVLEVMPHLRQRLPGVRFHVAGSNAPAEIQALACEDVIIVGFVEELNPLLDRMRVAVAPLRYGAGIKGKIGSAMTAGLPVVATSIAAEGMSLTGGANILVADTAEAIAVAVARLYEDEGLWTRLSAAGLAFAAQAWGAETAWRILADILTGIGMPVERGAHQLSLYAEERDHPRHRAGDRGTPG